MTTGNLSLGDSQRRPARPAPCEACEHAAGWAVLAYASRHQLDADQTADLLAALDINPKILKETR